MDRQYFEALPIEEKVSYMNERSGMKLKDVAKEIGIPPSSLSSIFIKEGYVRRSGLYVQGVKEEEELSQPKVQGPPVSDDLLELLQHKDELISLVLEERKEEKALDFSVLNEYKDESGEAKWNTLTFQIPEELHKQLDQYLNKRGYRKQLLLSLIVSQYLEGK